MKKLLVLCALVFAGVGMVEAAKPEATAQQKTTVFVTDIHCAHCAQKIENNVPSLGKGIKDVQVNVQTKEVTVTYDPAKNSDDRIVKGLASLKVKATPKAAPAKK